MSGLDGIRARLGSIAPSRMQNIGAGIIRLLTVDMPALIRVAEAANAAPIRQHWAEDLCEPGGQIETLNDALRELNDALADLGKKTEPEEL